MKDTATIFKVAAALLMLVAIIAFKSPITKQALMPGKDESLLIATTSSRRERFERRHLGRRGVGGDDNREPENWMDEKNEKEEEEVGAFWGDEKVTEEMKEKAVRDNKLLFVHIPKTGGTAVETAGNEHNVRWGSCMFGADYEYRQELCPYTPSVESLYPGNKWHAPPYLLSTLKGHPNPYLGAYLFVVVRNPYDRLISEYYYERHIDHTMARGTAKHMNSWLQDVIAKASEQKKGSQDYELYFGGHLIPQYDYVYDFNSGKRVVKHVILFETMHDDLNALWEAYSLPVEFPEHIINGGYDKKAGFKRLEKEDLSEDTVRLINRVYRDDFKLGNYPMLGCDDEENERDDR